MAELPRWNTAKRIGLDIETVDPTLEELGPGVRRGAYIAGVSFALEDGPSHYLPVRHYGGDNLPAEQVFNYLRAEMNNFKGVGVLTNANYDLDFLAEQGIGFHNAQWVRDVQISDPLINELHDGYSLEEIATRWGMPGKDTTLMHAAMRDYGLTKGQIGMLPARYVGPYAIQDVVLPLQLLRRQEKVIDEEDLWEIYNLETRVQPICLHMQRRGVKVNEDKLTYIEEWSKKQEALALRRVYDATGIRIPVGGTSKKSLTVPALQKIGVRLSLTKTGQVELKQATLQAIDHPVAAALLEAKKLDKLRNTFVASVRRHLTNGRAHCSFNQMRRTQRDGEVKGARFGRMSSSNFNFQQQPARDEFADMWRSIYEPDEPGQLWLCADFSQQEPRMLTHYAESCNFLKRVANVKAKEAGDAYRNNPNTDNHQMMADLCGIERKPAKIIYLGLCYGMGGAKLATELGLPTKWEEQDDGTSRLVAGDEAQRLIDTFNERAPFVQALAWECRAAVKRRGCITTILGRKLHFPMRKDGRGYDWLHKGINRLIQGGCADQMKQAMVLVYEAGLPMQLQVHDELDSSIDDLKQAYQIGEIMEQAVPMKVPSKVDLEVGPNWGQITGISALSA